MTGEFPGKTRLTEFEQNELLRNGPKLEYFEPWAKRAVMLNGMTKHEYGYVHEYSDDGAFNYDLAAWPSLEGLAWGLNNLWSRHTTSQCKDCRGVVFFAPDVPPRLRLVIEFDEEPEGAAEAGE